MPFAAQAPVAYPAATFAMHHYREAELCRRIDAASPHQLVGLLYEGAHAALLAAGMATASQQASVRLRSVTRAMAILDSLDQSLDHAQGGRVAAALALAYAQVRTLIVAGNGERRRDLIDAAAAQLRILGDSWAAIAPSVTTARNRSGA